MTRPAEQAWDPVQEWQRLYLDAARAAPSVAACVAAAFRLADQVWRQVAADPNLDTPTRIAMTGPTNWARTALATYEHLTDARAYAHLDLRVPLRCGVDPDQARAWLTSPSQLPGFANTTLAETWSITEDEFHWEALGIGASMATLIAQAQQAGVFGVPGYTITLRQVTTDDPDADPLIEHQITLRTPPGRCSPPPRSLPTTSPRTICPVWTPPSPSSPTPPPPSPNCSPPKPVLSPLAPTQHPSTRGLRPDPTAGSPHWT